MRNIANIFFSFSCPSCYFWSPAFFLYSCSTFLYFESTSVMGHLCNLSLLIFSCNLSPKLVCSSLTSLDYRCRRNIECPGRNAGLSLREGCVKGFIKERSMPGDGVQGVAAPATASAISNSAARNTNLWIGTPEAATGASDAADDI